MVAMAIGLYDTFAARSTSRARHNIVGPPLATRRFLFCKIKRRRRPHHKRSASSESPEPMVQPHPTGTVPHRYHTSVSELVFDSSINMHANSKLRKPRICWYVRAWKVLSIREQINHSIIIPWREPERLDGARAYF